MEKNQGRDPHSTAPEGYPGGQDAWFEDNVNVGVVKILKSEGHTVAPGLLKDALKAATRIKKATSVRVAA